MADATCSTEDDSHTPGPLTQGLCRKHYTRSRRHGDPTYVSPRGRPGTPEERFWPKVNKNGPVPAHRPDLGPCWVWTAAKDGNGYGRFGAGNKRTVFAHRFSYELLADPIPEDLVLDHLCRNTSCCRPEHLEPVPQHVNLDRGKTFVAANNTVTHCPQDHEYTLENTRVKTGPTGRPQRECRQCHREAAALAYAAKRARRKQEAA